MEKDEISEARWVEEILDSHRVIKRIREAGSEPATISDDDLD